MPPKIQIKLGAKNRDVSPERKSEKERDYRERDNGVAIKAEPLKVSEVTETETEQEEERGRRKVNSGISKTPQTAPPEEEEDELVVEEPINMMEMMGFQGFGTTKNKKVEGTDHSGVNKPRKTEYRQYMNREKGFNRPLSPSRGDRKIAKKRELNEKEQ